MSQALEEPTLMPRSIEPMLTVREVCEFLKVSPTTLFRYIRRKKDPIPSYKIGGGRKFKLAQIVWWVDKHEVS